MLLLLLATVLYSFPLGDALEMVVDDRERLCMVDWKYREAIDKFHNKLRQRVAWGATVNGKELGPEREMYGLVYDCALEKEANNEAKLPGYADLFHRGLVRFSGEHKGSALSAVEKALKTLYNDENAMRQLIYPKATRFGCWGTLSKGKKKGHQRIDWVCVYDKKPADGESLEGRNSCNEDKDCTYYKGSTCVSDLCYTYYV
ncbi:hypothetical protein Y032_0222g2618 [Ancylostoma ceylanicum]|uniref:SCP domain-containing protein n=1 Tax=Ancylostoma ceylanicum TaxID=53326 RepID=A0A016SIQ9_9BILA|nr:hypothetical protein Y032_0222g2618 [Ancylostoma ceylanicum]